jgi:nucleoid-associated protein YgaU
MGSVRQAVLEFDAEVRVPWRPLLREVAGSPAGSRRRAGSAAPGRPAQVTTPAAPAALRGSGPRVTGHLRPVPDRPAGTAVRTAGRAAGAPRTRQDPVRPAGRPTPTAPARDGVRRRGARAAAPLRLTRRGLRLVAVLVLAAAFGGAVLGREFLAPDDALRLVGDTRVVVEPGDTVWSIAGEVAGQDRDVRPVVDAIERLNDLEGSLVVPGQVLHLP